MNLNLTNGKAFINDESTEVQTRKSTQFMMPAHIDLNTISQDVYNIYPVHPLGSNKIFSGYGSLIKWIIQQKNVIIDGYVGVFWDKVESELNEFIIKEGLTVNWIRTADYLKPESEINNLTEPFLGTAESVWGTKCTLELSDLYRYESLAGQSLDNRYDINIVIGTAASMVNWEASVIYIDLPKNELQFRMRAGAVNNLGVTHVQEPFLTYKRFYFVDWVLLNNHKKQIVNKISVMADGEWTDTINWALMADIEDGLDKIGRSVFRVRPWFEPGAWGGQWIKRHIPDINTNVINYAWSFELIVPENGLVFESDGFPLEISFDFLMFRNAQQVLGKHASQFGDEFPIRFDFLDTYDGGNLSIQCHPRLKYIRDVFGENITQDETYYILDCQSDAKVYLGFQEDIDPDGFRKALVQSQSDNVELNIEEFVQVHPAQKHDLFLIPNGTIHSAGANNMVLEISATPYIFTFKMYDWLRLDLDGNPRPINIDHAFNNLNFDRKGDRVKEELISKQQILEEASGYQLVHLPTHTEHFYDVHRIEFEKEVQVENNNCCHVMMLVEGETIEVETADGSKQVFAYAETFVIPAAAKSYRITNLGNKPAKVIKAFLK
jgi:mannose-6-phosphate isomerase class I